LTMRSSTPGGRKLHADCFVGSRTGADVEDGSRVSQRRVNVGRDSRVRAPNRRVLLPTAVVIEARAPDVDGRFARFAHRAILGRSQLTCWWSSRLPPGTECFRCRRPLPR
jgi:hypothetical protein